VTAVVIVDPVEDPGVEAGQRDPHQRETQEGSAVDAAAVAANFDPRLGVRHMRDANYGIQRWASRKKRDILLWSAATLAALSVTPASTARALQTHSTSFRRFYPVHGGC